MHTLQILFLVGLGFIVGAAIAALSLALCIRRVVEDEFENLIEDLFKNL